MKDLFSQYAGDYAKYRPHYPAALFEFMYTQGDTFDLAWDVGTGNGQTAVQLSKKFRQVYATDISLEQINHATPANNIAYAQESSEQTRLGTNSVDLITVSQALHWFDFSQFYVEVNRVAKKDALIAAWTYNLLTVDDAIDNLIRDFYFETLANYWDAERRYVDLGYANLPFPYKQIEHPDFHIETAWTLEELQGYINTWSGLKKFIALNKMNPLDELIMSLKKIWPAGERKKIKFPLHLKLAKVSTFQTDI